MKFLQDLVPGCNKVWKNNNKLCSPTSAWFLLVQKFWSFLVVMMYTIFPCIYFMSFQAFPPLLLHLQESGRRISLLIEPDELILSVHVAL